MMVAKVPTNPDSTPVARHKPNPKPMAQDKGAELLKRYQQGERNFVGINLQGSNLSGAVLVGINLQAANLSQANLENSDLRDANLERANLDQANLIHTCLLGANLTDAYLDTISRHRGQPMSLPTPPSLSADLSTQPLATASAPETATPSANQALNAAQLIAAYAQGERDFQNLDLTGIDCQAQELNQANFQGSNLRQANFRLTDLQGANFQNANLQGANLSMADIHSCNFCGADLTQANLSGADRRNARYDDQTKFPAGFNPEIVGMIRIS